MRTQKEYVPHRDRTSIGVEMGDCNANLKKVHEVTMRTVEKGTDHEEKRMETENWCLPLTLLSLIIVSSAEFYFPAFEHLLPSFQLNFSSTATEARL